MTEAAIWKQELLIDEEQTAVREEPHGTQGDGCSDTDSKKAQEDTKDGGAGAGGGAGVLG